MPLRAIKRLITYYVRSGWEPVISAPGTSGQDRVRAARKHWVIGHPRSAVAQRSSTYVASLIERSAGSRGASGESTRAVEIQCQEDMILDGKGNEWPVKVSQDVEKNLPQFQMGAGDVVERLLDGLRQQFFVTDGVDLDPTGRLQWPWSCGLRCPQSGHCRLSSGRYGQTGPSRWP